MIYDCIVLGVGGVGSSALLSAARRGWSVLGIDRFGSAHDRGGSHGRTRMIRTAYFEHPNYVPLARRAWEKWVELESGGDVKLIQKTGLLQIGDPDGNIVQGVLRSAAEHEIPIQQLTAVQATKRFPAFKVPGRAACIFEELAGFLLVENCVTQQIKLAKQQGAEFQANTVVSGLTVNADDSISVRTDRGEFLTAKLIVCAGAWSNDLLESLKIQIKVLRKQQHWFQIDRHDIKFENEFPGFLVENDVGCFYGFPEIDYLGMKIAEHSGGSEIDRPENVNRQCEASELARAEDFLDQSFHFSKRRLVHHSVCMYSMTRDGHFVIDHHPDSNQIVFAAGLSGHGFKFAPLIGQRLVGLLEGETDEMFDFLKIENRQLAGEV